MKEQLKVLSDMGENMLVNSESLDVHIQTPYHTAMNIEFSGINAMILLAMNKDGEQEYVTLSDLVELEGTLREGFKHTTLWYTKPTGSPVAFDVFKLTDVEGGRFNQLQRLFLRDRARTGAAIQAFFEAIGIMFITTDGPSYISKGTDIGLHINKTIPSESLDAEYSTVFSGCIHWTRHLSRVVQYHPQGVAAVSKNKSYENLVAEIGAAFLSAQFGLKYVPTRHEFNTGWVELIQSNPEILVSAATEAQMSVDYMNNLVYDYMANVHENQKTMGIR